MTKETIYKATIKDPLDKIYALVQVNGKRTKKYHIAKESLYWGKGSKIYCKFDSKRNAKYKMKKGEAILPLSPDNIVIRPTEITINHYSRWNKNTDVTGYIKNEEFHIN